MTYKIPTRSEAREQAKLLIEGKVNPQDVGRWAEEIDYPENQRLEEELRARDPILHEFLDVLSLASETDQYGKEEYITWLQEFEDAIKIEQSSKEI